MHPLPVPGAHSRCRALPSAVSPLSLSHSPSLCATSPRDVSAARPPQPSQRTLHATQPPIASRCCCCFPAQRCHSDSRGIPSSALPPPRAPLGITHCSSSQRGRGKDRATAGDKQQGAANDGLVARYTWNGRESRGSRGKRAQSKQALTLPAAVPPVSPELFPPSHSLHSSLPGSSLFLSPTCSLLRGCAHEHRDGTNSPQTSLQRLLLAPTSRSEIRLLIRNSSPAPNQTIRSRWAHYH